MEGEDIADRPARTAHYRLAVLLFGLALLHYHRINYIEYQFVSISQ